MIHKILKKYSTNFFFLFCFDRDPDEIANLKKELEKKTIEQNE